LGQCPETLAEIQQVNKLHQSRSFSYKKKKYKTVLWILLSIPTVQYICSI